MEPIADWHYDRIVEWRTLESNAALFFWRKEYADISKDIKRGNRAIKSEKDPNRKKTLEETLERNKESIKNDLSNNATAHAEFTAKSHPFLIGPATLHSLLQKNPDDMHYIAEGKVPFEDMWFEFFDPIKRRVPGYGIEAKLVGMQINKSRYENNLGNELYDYLVTGVYQLDDLSYAETFFLISPSRAGSSGFTVRLPRNRERIILKNELIGESGSRDFGPIDVKRWGEVTPHVFGGDPLHIDLSIDESTLEPEQDALGILATNIINYINASNVTVVRSGTRRNSSSLNRRKGRTFQHEPGNEFHLLSVESKIVQESPRNTTGGSLEFQVYVIGHDRRYRQTPGDPSSPVKEVIWIEPHVRGPEDAPWKEHRYAALAGLLESEREMLRTYLPRKGTK